MACFRKTSVLILILITLLVSHNAASAQEQRMMVRISEIEIDADYLEEYKAILKEEAEASVRLEPGVISIFPMFEKENPTQVRILEIYASREAYESHLKTPHFQRYKTTTLKMVKTLKLVDTAALDASLIDSNIVKYARCSAALKKGRSCRVQFAEPNIG
jgi:quinol monooxygenase YgiN